MGSFRDLSLDRDRLAEGIRVQAHDMYGAPTGDWFQVRSEHSDEVQTALEDAEAVLRRDPDADLRDLKLKARVALVMAWSFDEECTPENVEELLRDQPWNADRIDNAAGNMRLFFPKPEGDSSSGSEPKSNSGEAQTESGVRAII